MAGEKPDVLLVGAKKPGMMKGLEGKVTLHHWLDAKDKAALVKDVGNKIKAIAIAYTANKDNGNFLQHYPKLVEMARDVDTLMVIVPGGASTKNMINAEVLKALGPRGVLINMARGSVVDEPALIEALQKRTIYSAGLDVFADEPNVPKELIAMEHIVLFPHLGSSTEATRAAMDQLVVDNILAWAAGKPPLTPVPETPWPPKR